MDPAALQQLLERQAAQIDDLHKRNEALQAQVTVLFNAIDNSSHNPHPRPRPALPTPETFTGNKWDTWQVYAQAKIDVDGAAIGNDKAQFWYLFGCLDSKIQAMVLPTASYESPTAKTILEALARVYDDPNKTSKAADRLTAGKVKQYDDESFNSYLARFEKTLHEAGARDWPDLAKVSTLRGGLGDSLKKKLAVQLIVPATYDLFVKALHQLAQGVSRGPAPDHGGGNRGHRYGSGGTKAEVNNMEVTHVGVLDCCYESAEEREAEEDSAEAFGY